jgi:hypothetical protein
VIVTLPSGLAAEVRPLRGADEAFLEDAADLAPARRATALLARCVAGTDEDAARALTVGDREALLLHLRRLTFGDALPCVLACPACEELMELDLRVTGLLLPPYEEVRDRYELSLGDGRVLPFRVPTGADQEEAAAAPPGEGARVLLERCVEEPVGDEVAAAVAREMAARDPQAELRLRVSCPACGAPVETVLDAADYLFRELRGRRSVYRDVHLLALHYGWSEGEILALPRGRRRLYLELLTETLAEGPVA